jgi:hypothetical protein
LLAGWLAGWLTEYTLLSNKYTHKQANRPQFKNYFFLSSRRNKDPGDTGGDAVVTIVSNSRVQNLRERRWHKDMHCAFGVRASNARNHLTKCYFLFLFLFVDKYTWVQSARIEPLSALVATAEQSPSPQKALSTAI